MALPPKKEGLIWLVTGRCHAIGHGTGMQKEYSNAPHPLSHVDKVALSLPSSSSTPLLTTPGNTAFSGSSAMLPILQSQNQ